MQTWIGVHVWSGTGLRQDPEDFWRTGLILISFPHCEKGSLMASIKNMFFFEYCRVLSASMLDLETNRN